MSKTAFLFPGQGSQFAGMGRSLAEVFPESRAVFEEADASLGFPISRLCFEGPEEELRLTENTQAALLTVSIAAYKVLEKRGLRPDYLAGHSLGEYAALVAAGSLEFSDAVRLVRKRGRFMQEAVPPGVGAMAAILKLSEEKLAAVLLEAAQGEMVTTANFNSPDQIVIAGHAGAVHRAADLAKAAGAKHTVLLHVSAPFHCPLMRPAQIQMAAELDSVAFSDLRTPVINNWQGREIHSAEDAREGLFQQIPSPVRWTQMMRYLAAKGVTDTIEVGAGGVLTGLLRRIAPEIKGHRFGEAHDWEKLTGVSQ
jgi:[acyl-carrier-protein] S-malonyltransferase